MKKPILITALLCLLFLASFYTFFTLIRGVDVESVALTEVVIQVSGQPVKDKGWVYVESFRPTVEIYAPFPLDTGDVIISLDESSNILEGDFYGSIVFDDGGYRLIFTPDFALEPEQHSLSIESTSEAGEEPFEIEFTLGYKEDFSNNIEESEVWFVPEGSSKDWFSVRDEALHVVPQRGTQGASSLAFLYTLAGDAVVDFEVQPLGDNVSGLFYFLNSRRDQFVFGSNNNHSMFLITDLIDGTNPTLVKGEDFLMQKEKRYHVRIVKQDGVLRFSAKELGNGEFVNPAISGDSLIKLLSYESGPIAEHPIHIGLAAWKNSDGFLIDDFFVRTLPAPDI